MEPCDFKGSDKGESVRSFFSPFWNFPAFSPLDFKTNILYLRLRSLTMMADVFFIDS